MTKREFLSAVVSLCALFNDQPADCVNIEDVSAKATELIAALDATNAKRRESDKPTKAKLEAAAARERVIGFVSGMSEPADAATIAEGANVTEGQVAPALRAFVTDGKVEKSIVKVDSKHRKTVYKWIGE